MRGILGSAAYIPHYRLDRSAVGTTLGTPPARGTRAVASYDEDTTTLGVEAARTALAAAALPRARIDGVYFSTVEPAYVDKTNATTIWAALRLDTNTIAVDMGGAVRSGVGALRSALDGTGTSLVVTAGMRSGRPGSSDETRGGDAGAAVVVGDAGDAAPVIAEYLGAGSATDEFVDRWRTPGAAYSKTWEERFAEGRYTPLVENAFEAAVKAAGLTAGDIDRLVVAGEHARAVKRVPRTLGLDTDAVVDDRTTAIGNPGAAQAHLLLTDTLETAAPGQVVAVVSVGDGADVLLFRTTDAVSAQSPPHTVRAQIAAGDDSLPYAKFLQWRGALDVEPPNRPEPSRPSASAAARNTDWKFGFVGSRDRSTEAVHMPPRRASRVGGAIDEMDPIAMADVPARVVSFTIDRLAYSPSPPIVFAVLDFDNGARMPCELTDVRAEDVGEGDRVEMTFRRLYTADGLHNYFWKARPRRSETS